MNAPPALASLTASPTPRVETGTSLSGYWLVLVRLLCLTLCALSVGFYIAGVVAYIANDYTFCTGPAGGCIRYGTVVVPPTQGPGLSSDFVGIYIVVRDTVFSLGYWLVAAFLIWRRSDDRVALLAAAGLGTFPLAFNVGFVSTLPSPWWFPASVVSLLGSLCFSLFFYVFPSGRFVPRFVRWVFVAFLIYRVLNTYFPLAAFNPFSRSPVLGNLIFFAQIVSFVVVQLYRYRWVSGPIQRLQTRWIVYGLSMGWGAYLAQLILSLIFPVLTQTGPPVAVIASAALYGFLLLIPLSIGLAILRTRLWDIDVVINRTLVYGCLSLCVVAVYVLVVGSLGALIGAVGNLGIELLATGLVAVLFQPLRGWVQHGVNHLLYGQRDEPYTVITRLSERLAGTLAPEAVLATIVETVAQALKLPYVAILLKQEDSFTLAASAGELVGEPLILPLVYQGGTVGQMQVAPRTPGEPVEPADRRLLDELARQAGLAAHALQLTADLRHAYEQLEQRVEERTRELSTLLEVSHNVASTLELKPLLGLILDQLKTVVDYSEATILRREEEALLIIAYRGSRQPEQTRGQRIPLEQVGSTWERVERNESVIINDMGDAAAVALPDQALVGELPVAGEGQLRSWMAVPLTLKDHVIGMVTFTARDAGYFTSRRAALAVAIANQAAMAIEHARLYERAQELAAVQERQRLARELHDSVSQALYGIALGVHAARAALERAPGEVAEALDYVLPLAEGALTEMRALIFELRPESLETEGLVAALAKQTAALRARYELAVATELSGEPQLPLPVKQELYRIAQEALQNTVKHAHARQAVLRLEQTLAGITLEVRDDGVGFDPQAAFPGHLGLQSMRERIAALGGTLQITSTPGSGTRIGVWVPGQR